MAAVLPTDEPTLEDIAPVAARQRAEAKRQLPIDVLLTLVSGGVAPITRGQAGRTITKGALEHIKPRWKALQWARKHLKGLATVPKEHLDPVRGYAVKPLKGTARGQFGTFTLGGEAGVLLNPAVESSITTVPHENIMHYLQYFAKDPRMKRMLKPVMEQIEKVKGGIAKAPSGTAKEYGSMIERHAREGTRRILREAIRGEKKIPRSLGKKRTEEIFEASLRAVLESEGWVP